MKILVQKVIVSFVTTIGVLAACSVMMPNTAHGIVSTLVTVANNAANPVPVQNVKRAEANYVSLLYQNGGYSQVLPDGSLAAFSIPSGQDFVITDVSWTLACLNLFTLQCNRSAGDAVVITLGGGGEGAGFYGTAVYQQGTPLWASGSSSFQSGYVVSNLPTPNFLYGASGSGESIFAVNLRGYLVAAPAPVE